MLSKDMFGGGMVLEYAKFKTPEIGLAAIEQNGYALKYVDSNMKTQEMYSSALVFRQRRPRYMINGKHGYY